jgi:hypothetical protein
MKCSGYRGLRSCPEAWLGGAPSRLLSEPTFPFSSHLGWSWTDVLLALGFLGPSISSPPTGLMEPLQALGQAEEAQPGQQGWWKDPCCHGDCSWLQNAVPENVGGGLL